MIAKQYNGAPVIVAFGRLYRIRFEVNKATLYLDALWQLGTPQPSVDLGITIVDSTPVVSRLGRPIFEKGLTLATGKDFSTFPIIEGKTPQEQAYIRELLQLSVMDDLLGPAAGPQEEIVGMSVRDRYLVGKLSPRTGKDGECIEGLRGPSALDEGVGDGKAPSDLKPLEETGEGKNKGGRRVLPGEEFATATGTTDPEGDEAREVDASKNQSFVPSSLGLTVCVDGSIETLELVAHWGRYVRTTSEEQTGDGGKPVRAWKRIPSGGKISIAMKPGAIKPVAPDANCPRVLVQGTVRAPLSSGERLVTIFLVNDQHKPEQNQDEAWVFQPELILRHSEGEAVFRRRPIIGDEASDPERAALEMIYRRRVEFAVGHGAAVHAEPASDSPERAVEVRTRVMPQYEVPVTEAPGLDPQDRPAMRRLADEGLLDMAKLAELERPTLLSTLRILTDDYDAWIGEQNARIGKDVLGCDAPAKQALARCKDILTQLREGIAVLEKNDKALAAFRFANKAMAAQRVQSIFALNRRRGGKAELAEFDIPKNRSWRPFQLAFILLSIPSLSDPLHKDRTRPVDAVADLLWFPTGGGKTEAYLGVAAITMAIRRLQGALGGLDASRGLSVIMRYTLRLLTVQQFQRATTLICAMETIRRADEKAWGSAPFTIGLWVGQRVTPNDTEDSHEAIEAERTGKRPTSSTPAQLTNCPWCGSEIAPGRDIEVRRFGQDIGRTFIYCGDKLGRCDFSRAKSKELGLPVLVVDDEIYRWPPSILIATVDKFAMMAWRGQVRALFGRATKECPRHGLLWPGAECNGKHQKKGNLPSVDAKIIQPLRPPDLIIQDELHLISGPLGTMVALYETAVDELATWKLDGKAIRPKVIASTATVRKAGDQVNNIFLRSVSVFPPHGLDVGDDFFSIQRPIAEKPGRRYLGICSPGSARPAVLIRLYTALLTAAEALFERFGPAADPWMSVVGYFNSLRELGGMRRLAEDDVQTRSFRVQMSRVARPGLAQRSVKIVDELTSRVPNKDIPRKLDQLEIMFKGLVNPETGRFKQTWGKDETRAIDVVLATNMLGVGVDVLRLGLMAVNGQPKSTAEYIQATSRVGRFFPGLVCTVLTWSRPRDLSHYETYEHYHATFYKHVEAQSVTPFAPRALDRGLTGTMVSCLRLGNEDYNPNLGASRLDSVSRPEVSGIKQIVSQRGGRVTGATGIGKLAEAMVGERCDEWVKEATRGGRRLGYEAGRKRKAGEDDIAALLKRPGLQPWDRFTVPLSLREVEAGVRLIMNSDNLPEGPTWKVKPPKAQKTGGAE
ncbi:MAG: DISARM system helicase DrmA [Planctomycetes bacterium]|nr:DISARM system helicase DrmA [Planctomycetota bacterium]